MKTQIVQRSWMDLNGLRLDGQPYLTGAIEARAILATLPVTKEILSTLTCGHNGGIYNGPQFARNYVDDPSYGIPFLTSASMLLADLSNIGLLSKRDAQSDKLSYLRIEEGMILISCSGTIGRMMYARPDMVNMWSSQDVLKVVTDTTRIRSGYLYAYLSSKFGIPLIVSGTYGAIIQHIEPYHIADLPVPRFDDNLERDVHDLITDATNMRSKALDVIDRSGDILLESLGLSDLPPVYLASKPLVSSIKSSNLRLRFDGAFHSPLALEAEAVIHRANCNVYEMSDERVTQTLFKPPIFKRMWVDSSEYGPAFVSGNDIYRMKPEPERYVSRTSNDMESYLLKKNWVVFQAAGQLNGLFGWPILVNSHIDGMFCADDVFRIVPHSDTDAGFIYAYLRTNFGQRLIKRQAYGYSIPRVVAQHVRKVLIPWPDENTRKKIGQPVVEAWEALAMAIKKEQAAVQMVEKAIEKGSA